MTALRVALMASVRRVFTISPAVAGTSVWDLDAHGPLNLASSGTWTIVPLVPFKAFTKCWGAGGADSPLRGYRGGAGGYAEGLVTLHAGVPYNLYVGEGPFDQTGGTPGGGYGGSSGSGFGGGGGGYSGVRKVSGEAVLIAPGGGGGAGNGTGLAAGGAGGGATGQAAPSAEGGQGGTQTAGGIGGVGSGYVGHSGSAFHGGSEFGSAVFAGGGGGGYFGGGSGGGIDNPSDPANLILPKGGGGGSGYYDTVAVTSASLQGGNFATPGNSGDADRGAAGNTNTDGRLKLS